MSLDLDKGTWKRVRLGDVVRRSRKQVDPMNSGIERYVAGGHVDSDGVIIERWGHVGDGQMGSTFRYVFGPGQVLFVSARPYLRKVGVPNFGGVVADKTYVLDAIPENGLLQEFLPFVLSSERFVEYATAEASGSMNPRLMWGPMQRYEFDLPSLDEQKRLSRLLWAVEREIWSASRLAESFQGAVRTQRRELMLEGDVVRASEVFEIEIGRQRSPKFQTGDCPVPYMRSANVKRGAISIDDVLVMDFTADEVERFGLSRGDVLVTEGCGSPLEVGAPARWQEEIQGPVCFQNTLLRYRPTFVDPEWLWQWTQFAFDEALFREAAAGTGILHIGLKRAREMPVRVPNLTAQRRIGELLGSLEDANVQFTHRVDRGRDLATSISIVIFGGTP